MTQEPRPSRLLVENGHLVDPSQQIDRIGRLLIVDGVITAIDPSDGDLPAETERLDAKNHLVAPGLVDLGVELREPGFEEDETIWKRCNGATMGPSIC
mgnify:CR=1 FL=1